MKICWRSFMIGRKNRRGEGQGRPLFPSLGNGWGVDVAVSHFGPRNWWQDTAHSGTTWWGLAVSGRPSARIAGGRGAVDSARHTLEECPAWAAERGVLVASIGPDLRLTAVLGAASAPNKWSAFLSFADAVMTAEVAERGRQAEAADALALGLPTV